MKDKLIIYELNELPRKLLEYYVNLKPNSNLSKFKKIGKDLNTITTDKGELHPWTTWPTFYRGVDNTTHGITSINQDIDNESKYPPVWKFLIKKDVSIGIFGTLQSYPPIINKKVKFYLPDTFSPNYKAYPITLEKFQKFNLKLVSNNSGEIRPIKIIEIIYFLDCIFNYSISIKSIIKIFIHILREKIFKNFRKRRSLLQPQLSFDLYYKYLKKSKPEFSTFFTNHLAGMMHYYWFDIFPEDFNNLQKHPNKFDKDSLVKALDIADHQIGILMKFAKKNSYQLWIASSMGQEAIERKFANRIFIKDFKKILNFLNLDIKSYHLLPSMYPDINIESDKKEDIDDLIKKFLEIKFLNSKRLINVRYRKNPNKVNFILGTYHKKENYIIYKDKKFNFCELGLEFGSDQIGTGYHTPNGILLTLGEKSSKLFKDKEDIDTKNIYSKILQIYENKK